MGRRTPVSAPPNLKNAPPRQFHDESTFEWMRRQNDGRAAPKEEAPNMSGGSAGGNDRNTYQGETIMNDFSVSPEDPKDWNGYTPTRFAVARRSGRQVHPDDITIQMLCNGDQATVGDSADRADYTIQVVK